MVSKLQNYIKPTHIYSIDEIISGIEGEKFSLVDNTSPGYPFKAQYSKKKDFIEDPKSKEVLEAQWNDWLSDHPYVFPNTMCSKDEILKVEKCKEPKPFYVVDVATTINGKRLVDDFNDQLGLVPGYFRGKTMYCGGLDETMSRHIKFKYHLPLDHKKYDAHRQAWVSEIMIRLRYHFMDEESKNISTLTRLSSFYSCLDQSETIDLEGTYHKRYGQMLTGSPVTLDDNTLSNDMIFIISCLRIFGRVPEHEKELMGDDTWASINQYVAPQKWIDAFSSIGYEVTGADKTVNGIYQELLECEFLKTTPVFIEGHWLPKYNIDRLIAILYFKKTDEGTIEQKINAVLQMSYGGPLYKKIRNAIPYTNFLKNEIFDDFRIRKLVFGFETADRDNKITAEKNIIVYQTMATNQIQTEVLPEETFNHLASNHQEKTINAGPDENFIAKMIHPPRSQVFNGLPTNDTRSQVTVEYVQQELTNQPGFLAGVGVFTRVPNATRLAYLTLNGLRVNHVAFVADEREAVGTGLFQQDVANTSVNTLYNFKGRFGEDVQLYRRTYGSHTSSLNATAFNDTGMVSVNQFNPNFLFRGITSNFAMTQLPDFIAFCKSMLKAGRLSEIKEEDEDISDFEDLQIKEDYKRKSSARPIKVKKNLDYKKQLENWNAFPKFVRDEIRDKLGVENLNINPDNKLQILSFGNIGGALDFVPDSSQILTQSTRSFGNPAKEGTFTVHRLNTIAPTWQAGSNLDSSINGGLYECYIACRATNGQVSVVALSEPTQQTVTPFQVLLDTCWTQDMTISWTLYEGLSYNNQALPRSNQSILIHKYYTGAEIQPALSSAFAGMAKLAPKPNVMLMQKLMDAFYDQKDSMPARFNFLGTLLSTASNLFMKHAPTIASKFLGEFVNGAKHKSGKTQSESKELMGIASMLMKNQGSKGKKEQKMMDEIEGGAFQHYKKAAKKTIKKEEKKIVKKEKKMSAGKRVTMPKRK